MTLKGYSAIYVFLGESGVYRGVSRDFEKGGSLYAGHHGWPTRKFWLSDGLKRAKWRSKLYVFGEIFLSVFSNVSIFMQWKFVDEILSIFRKSTDALIRKEKNTHTAVNEKRKTEKNGLCLIIGWFIKPFKIIITIFFRKLIRSAIFDFCYQDGARNIKMGNWERQIARHCKLQYLFKK